jgi:dipeptide/tripeptide permease
MDTEEECKRDCKTEERGCTCGRICPECGGIKKQLNVFSKTFWNLFLMKIFRNFASMKFQWLLLLYIPVIWGMLNLIPGAKEPTPWISATTGLGFLGAGFITLATSRIIARTKLTNGTNGELDTDK